MKNASRIYCTLLSHQTLGLYDGCKKLFPPCLLRSLLITRFASNIWAPNLQEKQVMLLGEKYQFSRRLLGIILTEPKQKTEGAAQQDKHAFWPRFPKDDPEVGAKSLDESRTSTSSQSSSFDHYTIADQMINYHAIDYGRRCKFGYVCSSWHSLILCLVICIGANWMHRKKHDSPETHTDGTVELEGKQRRLYSWLILCNDSKDHIYGPVQSTY